MLYRFREKEPRIGQGCFIFPTAFIGGDVELGENIVVYPGTVVRAEGAPVVIRQGCNLQENVTVHSEPDQGVVIGKDITLSHNAIVHACQIGDHTLIGMGAIVQNGAVIGKHCLIGAGALIKQNMQIPDHSLVYGIPARIVRNITQAEYDMITEAAEEYQTLREDLLLQNLPQAKKMY